MGFAPITGAWIETSESNTGVTLLGSHLSQVRGLKQVNVMTDVEPVVRTYHRCVD